MLTEKTKVTITVADTRPGRGESPHGGGPASWLADVEAELVVLSNLQSDWDSYQAQVIDGDSIKRAAATAGRSGSSGSATSDSNSDEPRGCSD